MVFFKRDHVWDSICGLKGYMFDWSNLKKYAKIDWKKLQNIMPSERSQSQKNPILYESISVNSRISKPREKVD